MNPTALRVFGSRRAVLFGSTSLLAIACGTGVQAQQAAPDSVEEVLVTGSLIHGEPAVGVPVTTLSAQEFRQTGALTVSDLLKSVPSIEVNPSTAVNQGGGQINRGQNINIHNLSGTTSFRTLLLFDGMRYPVQGSNTRTLDPSIIPQLAVERVDVLADGASATYGSDAVAGVVNVIMKRGYDGAVTQLRYGKAEDGNQEVQLSQLFGKTWDGGDITVSYEGYDRTHLPPNSRPGFTVDFTPWGLDNRTPITSSIPGTVSTGAPNQSTGTGCTNCYSIPAGQNGEGLTWAKLLANKGVTNEINPYNYSDILDAGQRNAVTFTFDQRITDGVEFFAEGFYSNRRSQIVINLFVTPAGSNALTATVPTSNPFYPIGAPSGLRVSYSLVTELPPEIRAWTRGGRYTAGFNLDLPFDWKGKVSFSTSDDASTDLSINTVNVNALNAALGNAVGPFAASGTTPGVAAYTKPASIPYLNLFCDPTAFPCNDQRTLDYIKGYRTQYNTWILHEYDVNFDGPLFALPAGEVKAAFGGMYVNNNYVTGTSENDGTQTPSPAFFASAKDPFHYYAWAMFAQLDVPIFSESNAIPLFRKLDVEIAGRYDRYSTVGGTSNPKFSMNWEPLEGLTIRGSMGTAFRAPSFGELSAISGVQIQPTNIAGGATTDTLQTCPKIGGLPVPGSAGAIINPTCSAALQFASGIITTGGAGAVTEIRGGKTLEPETAHTLSLGFEYTPNGFLAGLDLGATYFRSKTSGFITPVSIRGLADGLTNPDYLFTMIFPSDPNFKRDVDLLVSNATTNLSPAFATTFQWINDGSLRNAGNLIQEGVDFSANYAWDLGEEGLGAWHAGIAGTVYIQQTTVLFEGSPPMDVFRTTVGAPPAQSFGVPTSSRYRWRAQLGWEDNGFSVTLFANYKSHYYHTNPLPPAAFLVNFPDYSNIEPPFLTYDLSLGYNTEDRPENDYLKNLDFRIVALNVLDKDPAFLYRVTTGGGSPSAFDSSVSPLGRFVTFVLTKTW